MLRLNPKIATMTLNPIPKPPTPNSPNTSWITRVATTFGLIARVREVKNEQESALASESERAREKEREQGRERHTPATDIGEPTSHARLYRTMLTGAAMIMAGSKREVGDEFVMDDKADFPALNMSFAHVAQPPVRGDARSFRVCRKISAHRRSSSSMG